MSDTTITCPKCGAAIPLTEAVSHRIREELTAEFNRKLAGHKAALAAREEKLAAERAALDQRAAAVQAEVARALESERARLRQQAAAEAGERLAARIKEMEERLASEKARREEAERHETELRRQKWELEQAREKLDIELNRRLDEERAKIAEDARKKAAEAERLNLAQKEKIISDLQHEIAALKQRAEQGSVQLQGETLEITLETDLKRAFPHDFIEEVKKGQRGADVKQTVRTSQGGDCGVILWEAKRAKNWSGEWLDKLKEDQRSEGADLAVLVATCLPPEARGIGQIDGVWVCDLPFAVALAAALRQGLLLAAVERVRQAGRADKKEALYDFLCGTEFRHRIEAIVGAFTGLKLQLDAEKRAFARQWKEREQQLERAIANTAMLYGSVQGIAGRETLPELPSLALPGGAEEPPPPAEPALAEKAAGTAEAEE